MAGALGGRTYFFSGSAASAVITSEGASISGAEGGLTQFINNTDAGSATVIAQGGSNGGGGGSIQFQDASFAPSARIEVFGNGNLDITEVDPGGLKIGSLEGDGRVFLGFRQLSVGANNLDTTFSGVIQDSGSLAKIGKGILTLTGASVYTAGTTVTSGTLVAANPTGSATGTGAVTVTAGTLAGSGAIAGAVTVGTGSGTGAFLAPAHGTNKHVTLTIQSALTFNSDATYTYTFKAKSNKSKTDKVVANGVTINSGGTFNLSGTAQGTLTQGTVLTVIKNMAATPIAGTFSNLTDGAIVSVNGNNLQASYEGGDGNDLNRAWRDDRRVGRDSETGTGQRPPRQQDVLVPCRRGSAAAVLISPHDAKQAHNPGREGCPSARALQGHLPGSTTPATAGRSPAQR